MESSPTQVRKEPLRESERRIYRALDERGEVSFNAQSLSAVMKFFDLYDWNQAAVSKVRENWHSVSHSFTRLFNTTHASALRAWEPSGDQLIPFFFWRCEAIKLFVRSTGLLELHSFNRRRMA